MVTSYVPSETLRKPPRCPNSIRHQTCIDCGIGALASPRRERFVVFGRFVRAPLHPMGRTPKFLPSGVTVAAVARKTRCNPLKRLIPRPGISWPGGHALREDRQEEGKGVARKIRRNPLKRLIPRPEIWSGALSATAEGRASQTASAPTPSGGAGPCFVSLAKRSGMLQMIDRPQLRLAFAPAAERSVVRLSERPSAPAF